MKLGYTGHYMKLEPTIVQPTIKQVHFRALNPLK